MQKNRERLIEMFVRKVVFYDDKPEPDIYYNGFDDNADIKESVESEIEFGFDALGGDGIVRTAVELPGVLNGRAGWYQYIIEPNGTTVNHRSLVIRVY